MDEEVWQTQEIWNQMGVSELRGQSLCCAGEWLYVNEGTHGSALEGPGTSQMGLLPAQI